MDASTHISLDLDGSVIDMVVFDIAGKHPGPTVLVTGGVDGDEYAGMEACYRLKELYAGGDFSGRLIIVPIVNVPGFWHGTGDNPLDGKYPKLVGLGNAHGTPSARLMHWLAQTYARHAQAWIDLHGGSLTEELTPFLWAYRTGVKKMDEHNEFLCVHAPLPMVILEKVGRFTKAGILARRGCWYVVVESGELGRRDAKSISYHMSAVQMIGGMLGMVPAQFTRQTLPVTLLSRVQYATAPCASLWTPMSHAGDRVQKHQELGVLRHGDGRFMGSVRSGVGGVVLWNTISLPAKRRRILMAIGSG